MIDLAAIRSLQDRLCANNGPFALSRSNGSHLQFARGLRTLTDLYRRCATYGSRDFISNGVSSFTYDEVFIPALRRAMELTDAGHVRCGQRIALPPGPLEEWLSWFISLTSAGAVCVLLPSDHQLWTTLALEAGCEWTVCLSEAPAAATGDGQASSDERPWPLRQPDDEAVVFYTSGSSGRSKGVIHTHGSLAAGLQTMLLGGALRSVMCSTSREGQHRGGPVALHLAPPFYVGGIASLLLTSYLGGRAILSGKSVTASETLQTIRRHEVRSITGLTQGVLNQWLSDPDSDATLANVASLYLHGEALRSQNLELIAKRWPWLSLSTGYGLTETFGSVSVGPAHMSVYERGLSGWMLPSVEVRTTDMDGRALEAEAAGLIELRGPMVAKGYTQSADTEAGYGSDGWLRTFDYGYVRAGLLYVFDRASRRLSTAPQSDLWLNDVEQTLLSIPGVQDALAYVLPEGGLCVRVAGQCDATLLENRLRDEFCFIGLIEIEILADLPRLASGKLDRRMAVTS